MDYQKIANEMIERIAAGDWEKREKHWFKQADKELKRLNDKYYDYLAEEQDLIWDELHPDVVSPGFAMDKADIDRKQNRMEEISKALKEKIDPRQWEDIKKDPSYKQFDNFATNWLIALHRGDDHAAENVISKARPSGIERSTARFAALMELMSK